MIKKLICAYHIASIYDLKPESIASVGFTSLFADIDNTLVPYDSLVPEQRTYQFIDKCHQAGIEVYLISNNTSSRVEPFADRLHAAFICSMHKPCTHFLKKYIKAHSIPLQESIIVGDQLFTDMHMATRIGMKAILCDPLSAHDHWVTRLIRPIDRLLRAHYLKQGRLGKQLSADSGKEAFKE